MPIYEYRCQSCQHEMEVMQKMSDEALVCCDACGKDTLTKLISRSSFQLKGTGWYQTDFKNPVKPNNQSNAKSDAQIGSKTDSKPETKSDTTTSTAVSESSTKKTSDTSKAK